MSLARAALTYASTLGWAVFPCAGKVPIPRIGHNAATTDPRIIENWWKRRPDSNVAVAPRGVYVLDVDTYKGGDEDLDALEAQHGPLPETPTAYTGGGGRHLFFACPTGLRWRRALSTSLDVKADGRGYVVAAPSIHPETGRTYEWDLELHPLQMPLAPLPGWLLGMSVRPEFPDEAATGPAADALVARALHHAGLAVRPIDRVRVAVECPWAHEHTTEGATSTVVFAPTKRAPSGTFHCSHSHCHARRTMDVLAVVGPEALGAALADSNPDIGERIAIVEESAA